MTKITRYMALALVAVFCGCSGVKGLKPAEVAEGMPAEWAGMRATDSLTMADMGWWEMYTDTTLVSIIRQTLDNNRDMLKAAARVEELRQLYGVTKLNYTPEITADAYANRETNDYNGNNYVNDPETGVKVSLAWEMNLWGALTWSQRSAKANYMASVEDCRAMRMTLVAEVASAYFRLVALDNELAIVRRTLVTRKEGVDQARLRFEGGLTSETVYQQAQVEYATTAALVPNLEMQIAAARNAITLLMGEYPDIRLDRGHLSPESLVPPTLPVGLPSELLQRRPDIRAAEQRLQGAMANVGLTYADRFPRLRLALSAGVENDGFGKMFESPFTYMAGSLAGSVFDFGRKKRRYKASIAAYDQARFAYEQTVLTAFSEVSTAITAFRKVQETAHLKLSLRDAARKYVDLAHLQYRAGSLNYLDVLDAQRRYFDAQIGLSNAVRDEYLAIVSLYKTLGGGWQVEDAR